MVDDGEDEYDDNDDVDKKNHDHGLATMHKIKNYGT